MVEMLSKESPLIWAGVKMEHPSNNRFALEHTPKRGTLGPPKKILLELHAAHWAPRTGRMSLESSNQRPKWSKPSLPPIDMCALLINIMFP